MKREFIRIRETERKRATAIGIVLTVLLHGFAAAFVSFTGLKYIWPPPEENTFVVDFIEEEIPKPKPKIRASAPQSVTPDKQAPVKIVQQSKLPEPSHIEAPELDPLAEFPGMAKKSPDPVEGNALGNSVKGPVSGMPNAHVEGRKTIGDVPRPVYNVQESGTVVVTIWVDNYGNVKKAIPGADGTTVTNKELWAAARNAAMETHFNMKADAPAMQQGAITYIFNLK